MLDPFQDKFLAFDSALAECWQQLGAGAADRRHGLHHATVATFGLDGVPKARVVIVRAVDAGAQTIRFHTDARSQKIAELAANPSMSMTLYDPRLKLQLRLEGRAQINQQDEGARAHWQLAQRMSRVCYGTTPASGAVMASHSEFALPQDDAAIEAGYANFAAVTLRVHSIEWLYLRAGGHLRARHDLPSGKAEWLVP